MGLWEGAALDVSNAWLAPVRSRPSECVALADWASPFPTGRLLAWASLGEAFSDPSKSPKQVATYRTGHKQSETNLAKKKNPSKQKKRTEKLSEQSEGKQTTVRPRRVAVPSPRQLLPSSNANAQPPSSLPVPKLTLPSV
jgi:hypothetical protein